MSDLLQLRDVSLSFKGVKAVNALSFSVATGEICALIGPNGAGKSSLLNVINGVYRADTGDIVFNGARFGAIHPQKAALLGIGRTFQHNALFHRLTVRENVLAGLSRRGTATFLENIFRFGRDGAERRRFIDRADEIIAFLHLDRHAETVVSKLSYGMQKRVDLARALAAAPKLLLLDEPMAGMNQEEKQEMSRVIAEVNRSFGTTIVLIEHDVGIVLNLASHVVVLDYGRKVADGTPDEVRNNPDVIAAYLGTVH
ncbi:amino acid/amide ABC transporter ATP-binding protein 1 (HAAT family) [Rhizobium sp. PP-F2F-G38]|uniref:ABC transporter ATP-binding protein n=1 Tax=Ferranicluibacter rubi TaxID=2715133 RepID=A0AA43ZGY5_9HYPH|nr:ABC transporter ATP-binding protein [Ferranicluibacter rubi]PYE31104.1 amino acid/amide ABC transporter ATP-binding protein 1 (HAAT family) [Rhizobium sp. PP-WC-1G-195]PYE94760.1 amino acid/amide ABC transporter ATP-binding protein 1 (HAAT family) [Rhizobium sp. PP-F2F-G38]TCQ05420.1 amino acid/amide ABC transporter ATP-binding protein 1 (HAAT family) [Rhizobium sp. PP-F2F-G36]TCQ26059.1 amino acid/amide ABC transporter ATP-binding protein 1 (HAAT family) [Rhizobium sp. PP-CC-3G-465]NHT7684